MTHDPVNHHPEQRGAPVSDVGQVVRLPIPLRRSVDATVTEGTSGPGRGDGAFTIDCAACAHQGTPVCDDCVVSFIVGRAPEDALVVDADEARAVRLLERAGLLPGVRHEAQASGL